jgi:hypothetical protein
LFPDLHPFSRLSVNLLFSNLKGDFLNQGIPDGIHITGRRRAAIQINGGQQNINIDSAEQVTPSRNETGDALAEVGRAVKVHGLGLHRKVCIPSIYHFKEGYLWIPCQEDILFSLGD